MSKGHWEVNVLKPLLHSDNEVVWKNIALFKIQHLKKKVPFEKGQINLACLKSSFLRCLLNGHGSVPQVCTQAELGQ